MFFTYIHLIIVVVVMSVAFFIFPECPVSFLKSLKDLSFLSVLGPDY